MNQVLNQSSGMHTQPGVKETHERIRSAHLDNERSIWICEPVVPAAENLVIFLDGELYRDRVGAVSVIDGLQGRIADSWFVFVSAESVESRWRECPCHRPFASFVVGELLPWLESRLPALKNVRRRTLVGLSYTGLAAAFVVHEHPGVFQRVICQSGSFWWDDCWLTRQFRSSSPDTPTDFYLDVGSGETQENVRHREDVLQVVSQIQGVRRFRDMLLQRGYPVKHVEFDGGHDFEAWKKALPEALIWALPKQP